MKSKFIVPGVLFSFFLILALGSSDNGQSDSNGPDKNGASVDSETEIVQLDTDELIDNAIDNQENSFKRLEAAKSEYYGVELTLYGRLELSDYFNCGYGDAENSHYSFRLKDNEYNEFNVYFKKAEVTALFDQLIEVDKIPVEVKVIASKRKQGICDLMFEGLGYSVLDDSFDFTKVQLKKAKSDSETLAFADDITELIESKSVNYKRLSAAKTEYYGKEFDVYGYIELSDYYNCGYGDSESSHYSFVIKDGNRYDLRVYFKKSISQNLFDLLVDNDKLPVRLKVKGTKKDEGICDLMCEGIDFEIIMQ